MIIMFVRAKDLDFAKAVETGCENQKMSTEMKSFHKM